VSTTISTILLAGIACLIGSVVGGNSKAFGVWIPALRSGNRQLALGLLGILLVAGALYKAAPIDHAALSAELQTNSTTIENMKRQLSENEALAAGFERSIESFFAIMNHPDATDRQRAEAQAGFVDARSRAITLRKLDRLLEEKIGQLAARDREIERMLSCQLDNYWLCKARAQFLT
jgi:hypothetical protein